MSQKHHLRPHDNTQLVHEVTPEDYGWSYLAYKAVKLTAGESFSFATEANEAALVPLQGQAVLSAADQDFQVARQGVFEEKPQVLYAPPGQNISVTTISDFEFAIGTAPAEGKYPLRLFKPEEMRTEVRGGGAALREVHHILSHPLPAERLILFEVYIPGGMWSGWPPHCHDRYLDSPYLEETYHYRFSNEAGFGLHRNYRRDNDFNEVFAIHSNDLVLVTQGFHPVAASPGTTMYFLNYLAGDLLDEARATPPVDDPDHAWIKDNWDAYDVKLPLMD